MTDANGKPRTIVSSDATQLIPTLAEREPVTPLDLPKANFGGYQARAVEELVADLRFKLSAAARSLQESQRVIAARQMENGKLNQRIADLTQENQQLKHAADNPVEALGQAGQALINLAKGQADDIRAKVRAEEEQRLASSRQQAERIVADAERDAKDTVDQAKARAAELGEQAKRVVAQSRTQADHLLAEAHDKAAALEKESAARAEQAKQLEAAARASADEAYRTLTALAARLKP